MSTQSDAQAIVGRGVEEGAGLFRDWFSELTRSGGEGGQAAYVFVMGSLAEILRTFDFGTVFPEINSLQTAVRKVAAEHLAQAEDYGYSPDICGYVKADVATQLRGGEHPMGRIPPPALAVLTNACNTYIKWAEIWERMYQMPVFTLDVPGTRAAGRYTKPGDDDFERDRRYVQGQLEELIELCVKVSGKPFDIDRLREALRETNRMMAAWHEILLLNRARPAPFNALGDGTVYLGMLNAYRATAAGADYFERLRDEMKFKVEHGLGTLTEENYRLLFVGVPCYPIFRRFGELFSEHGGQFVGSTYLYYASGGGDLGYQYDLDRPIESLAEGLLLQVSSAMDRMFFPEDLLLEQVDPFGIDGLVFHPIKSCRTTSTGMADVRRAIQLQRDTPSLLIESDMMDKRVVSEAQLKNRIDAFFEGMASRRAQSGGKA